MAIKRARFINSLSLVEELTYKRLCIGKKRQCGGGKSINYYHVKKHSAIGFVICFFGLASCGKSYDAKKIVRNNSSHSLKVLIYKRLYPGEISRTFSIQPQNEVVIESFSGGKTGPYYENGKGCGNRDFDSTVVEVIDDNQLLVAKNLNSSDSWTFSKHSTSGSIDEECRATIIDADIVPK
ncbi:hypothetical protein [Niabella drilacis]|uniref:Uncharacterized protein n=1 Tax=Niabella drilacis (strain DSM 25811 / CCM 8410 / CCUG 62505 / LMG 26954 / E90) TaxID=1285928 RepID=A0A1G7BHT1_NIADE|nr:hypothetical protein [Niabella drilacis]SDE26651.1 hypothetical protein SAMN04487894_1307 [Niabella drilacis]